ncbi:MAG: DinB family protein [Pirellulales bacterium]|nr:DinB family protein [Pirellulales bacterium]
MTLSELLLPEFDEEMVRTRKVLAVIPAEQMGWQAKPEMRSVAWNANHLAEIVGWTAGIVASDSFDVAPVGGPRYETPDERDPAKVLAAFDAHVAAAREALAGASDAVLAESWSLLMGGQPLFTMPKGACLRTWVMNHTIHHRAILATYLRLCGVDVPPVFGA